MYSPHIMKEVFLPLSCENLLMNERSPLMKNVLKFFAFATALFMTTTVSFAQPIFTMSEAQPDPGDTVEIDVTVADFVKISSFQYLQSFDSLMLEYVDVINKSSMLGGLSHLGPEGATVDNGNIVLTWNDPLGENVTLPDDERIYTVRFVAIGNECDSSYVDIIGTQRRKIEVLDENFDNIGLDSVPGLVHIPGNDCMGGGGGTDIVIKANDVSGDNGTNVCVQVRVDNFTEVESMQFSMSWDPNIITYTGVQNFNLVNLTGGSFGSTMAGSLRCIWDEGSGGSATLANNTRIFDICFDIVGSSGQMSDVDFVDSPIPIEFNTTSGTSTHRTNSGKVTVTGGGGGGEVELILGEATGDCNTDICIPLTVKNFNEIESFQFSLNFSPELEFVRAQNFTLAGYNAGLVFNPQAGIVRSIWADPNGDSQTIPDNQAIAEFCFKATDDNPNMFDIDFSDTPLRIEVLSSSGDEDVVTTSGKISINPCGMGPDTVTVSVNTLENDRCPPAPGVPCRGFIILDVSGGSGVYTYTWFLNGQPLSPQPGGATANRLCAGNYSVEVVDANNTSDTEFLDNLVVTEPDGFMVNLQTVGVTSGCNGQAAYEVEGGTPPYFYRWSTGNTDSLHTDLCKGTYNLTITDAQNCVFITDSFTLAGPPLVIGNPIVTPTTCYDDCDGAIQINPTGGCGVYTFQWTGMGVDPTAQDQDNLCSGQYNVTVTDTMGSQVMTTITVNRPDSIKIDLDSIQNGMIGGVYISLSGGTGPGSYTISWRDANDVLVGQGEDLTNIGPGTYKVTVIDGNGCMRMKSFTISLSNLMLTAVVSDYNGVNISCNGFSDGTITVNVSGGSGNYTYRWDHDATATGPTQSGLPAATYRITVMDMLDMNTQVITVTLTEPDVLDAEVLEKNCASGDGIEDGSYEVIPSGGTAPYSFLWCNNNTFRVPLDLEGGSNCNVLVTDANGCQIFMDNIEICTDTTTGPPIDTECFIGRDVISPNGDRFNEFFLISCMDDPRFADNELIIFNRWGQTVNSYQNYRGQWNGLNEDGEEVDEDTYLWVFKVELSSGEQRIFRGAVTVLRN